MTHTHASLSFDGKGINDRDEFRSRIATFTTEDHAKEYGALFAAAPELLAALNELLDAMWHHIGKRDVKKHYSLLLYENAALYAIAKATAKP